MKSGCALASDYLVEVFGRWYLFLVGLRVTLFRHYHETTLLLKLMIIGLYILLGVGNIITLFFLPFCQVLSGILRRLD